jgi:O-antigen ligase
MAKRMRLNSLERNLFTGGILGLLIFGALTIANIHYAFGEIKKPREGQVAFDKKQFNKCYA